MKRVKVGSLFKKAVYKFRSELYVFGLIVLVMAVLARILKAPFYIDVIIMIAFYGAISSAWNILGGYVQQFSLGHAVFFGVGGYTSVILYTKFGIPPLIGMFMGALMATVVAAIIGYPCFRLKGPYFVLATLTLGEIFRQLSNHFKGLTNGAYGILVAFSPSLKHLMFLKKASYAYVALIYLVVVVAVSMTLKKSRIGYYWTAIGENENTAEACGVKTTSYKFLAILISAFLTGLGGTFYFFYVQLIDPDSAFSVWHSINFTLFTVVGGIRTILGPVIGSLIMTPMQTLTMTLFGNMYAGLSELIYGIILIMVVLFMPRGVVGNLASWFQQSLPIKIKKEVRLTQFPVSSLSPNPAREDIQALHEKIEGKQVLEIKDFSKSFGGVMALSGVSLTLYTKEILGIIGPNGAGKTTLFNTITGFIQRDKGNMRLYQQPIPKSWSPHKICRHGLARTFQLMQPFGSMSVFDNVLIGSLCRLNRMAEARENTMRVLEFTGLLEKREQLAESLVPGEQKRLEVARELATSPTILLLDEVMAGLNSVETDQMIKLIKEISNQGISIIIIEHIMKVIMSLSDRIIVLDNGMKIAEGKPEEIAQNENVIKAYLGEEYIIARG